MVIVATASAASTGRQATVCAGNNWSNRVNAIAAPILGATVRKAAAGGGEPSATSGSQACAGTAASLKATPTTTSVRASSVNPCGGAELAPVARAV